MSKGKKEIKMSTKDKVANLYKGAGFQVEEHPKGILVSLTSREISEMEVMVVADSLSFFPTFRKIRNKVLVAFK